MKFFIFSLIALLTVLLMTSCSSSKLALRQSGGRPASSSGAAFEAQQVGVDYVSAWSRYQKGDKAGARRFLASSAKKLRKKGMNPREIEALSRKVSGGGKVSEREFEQTFASSHRELAGYYRGQADTQMVANQGQSAGAAMTASAYHTQQSAQWSGQPLSAQEQREVSNLQTVGGALQTGSAYLVKGSGYLVKGTGWVLGKGFQLLTSGGERTVGRTGDIMRGTGRGGAKGSMWIENAGGGINRFGDWILRR